MRVPSQIDPSPAGKQVSHPSQFSGSAILVRPTRSSRKLIGSTS